MSKDMNLRENILPCVKLNEMAEAEANNYVMAQPYAHAVFDDVFDKGVLEKVLEEFEKSDREWYSFDRKYEKKLMINDYLQFGPVTRSFFDSLNSSEFLRFLEKLTGINGLIPDPYLVGAGMHKIARGGKLGIHVDFNQHKHLNLYRRLNVLVYLNKDWEEEYGGHFELWDEKVGCKKKVLPIFNRMALFSTTNTSFHGHPQPLNCPENRHRKSLALYYYTADKGIGDSKQHGTIFIDENGKRVQTHVTSFKERVLKKFNEILKG